MKNFCIIGVGRQGTAAVYDLLRFAPINKLLLLDTNQNSINSCLKKIEHISNGINIDSKIININNRRKLISILDSYDIFLSSVPYKYNLMLTEIAVESSTSMVDLGGHTKNVIKQLEYHNQAIKKIRYGY